MRRIHEKLIALVEKHGFGRPTAASREELAAAEKALGRELPPGYRRFLTEVGPVHWPLHIGLIDTERWDSMAPHLVPFGSDGGGNQWCFDTRVKGSSEELPITFWDHEEPEEANEDEPGEGTPFEEWLEERVTEALDEEDDTATEERTTRVANAIAPHATGRFTPSVEEARTAGTTLGVNLPNDYVWFTTRLGSTDFPLRIFDAMDLVHATKDERGERSAKARLVVFARDADGAFAFDAKGAIVRLGPKTSAPLDGFLDLVEHFLRTPSAAKTPPPANDEESDLPRAIAKMLVAALLKREWIAPAEGFREEQLIADLARAPQGSGTALFEWLCDRSDVDEVFASEDDLDVILQSARRRA